MQTENIKRRRHIFWLAFDGILFGLYFAAAGMVLFCQWDHWLYLDGQNGTNTASFVLALGVQVWLFMIVLLFVFPFRFYFWKYLFATARKVRLVRTVTIGCLILCNPLSVAFPVLFGEPHYVPYLQGFQQRVKRADLNAEKIKEWLETIDDEAFGKVYDVYEENGELKMEGVYAPSLPGGIPEELLHLSSEVSVIELRRDDANNRFVSVGWEHVIKYHGIVVGPSGKKDLPDYGDYRLEIEDGVYVWSD